ncbi:hypothetical protein A3Q56_07376 [Intoshia linei]|uniref:Transmembrane protein 231 n=1 Tax=Intoshia linei TaxID=1819745 RepID=A0A177ASG6_9BILA|nr:hypothetical protein A3Q56_07376 [Intoshia linei]
MVLKTIYKQPEYRIYRAHSCSFARFFTLFMKIVCIIVPFILAYRTEGLWKLTDIHTEKPNIQFSYSMLAYIYLKNDRYVTWSTFDNFNHIEMPNLRIPVVTSYEEDTNFDDKNDILYLNLSFPLNENEQVVGVQIYLVFDYVLEK